MIGQTIQSKPRSPVGAVLFLLLGGGLIGLGVVQKNPHWAIGSAMPLAISVALWVSRPRAFAAHFTETTLEVMDPPLSIPYETIDGLRAKGRSTNPDKNGPRSYPMHLHHHDGILQIPARLNVHSDDVYRFLLGQFSLSGSRDVNEALRPFLTQQEEQFGADHVWSYTARKHLGTGFILETGRAVSAGVFLSGLVWIGAGFLGKDYQPWFGGAFMACLFGALFFLAFWLGARHRPPRLRTWRSASLVIAPVGIAMVQGGVKGQMRWDELKNVTLKAPRFSYQNSQLDAGPGIRLGVEGATIVIGDLYDRPLAIIHRRILEYWRP
jgi:hypothetical protein